MNDLKMTLANGEEVAIDSFALPLHVIVNSASKTAALAVWQKLTPANLETVTFFENEEQTAEFANVKITSVQFVMNEDSNVITSHYFMCGENRSNSDEDDYVTAAKILLGEEE